MSLYPVHVPLSIFTFENSGRDPYGSIKRGKGYDSIQGGKWIMKNQKSQIHPPGSELRPTSEEVKNKWNYLLETNDNLVLVQKVLNLILTKLYNY